MATGSSDKMIGEYTIKGRPLGTGGMATVYLVEKNSKQFAAKVLHPHLIRERKTVERFKQEFNIGLKMASNPAFVQMLELFKHDGSWIIIMEYVPGLTLHDVITKMAPLSVIEATAIAYELGNALGSFHLNNFVHRDLKPGNIIICPNGQVKIMDYGVTRDLGTNLTKTGTAVGTPLYMAPEQICGSKSTDCRCDIYSLALIFYQMLTRRDAHGMKRNFEFVELVETRIKKPVKPISDLANDSMAFIEKCLAPNPDERLPTTKEFCEALSATKAFDKKRSTCIKKILKTLEVNNNAKKAKASSIEKTIVHKPSSSLLKKLVLISGAATLTATSIALYTMGFARFIEAMKGFFKQFF
jgi:eukaryotic-like serine/threonine-protein kinase